MSKSLMDRISGLFGSAATTEKPPHGGAVSAEPVAPRKRSKSWMSRIDDDLLDRVGRPDRSFPGVAFHGQRVRP
jgi:hypothetical protein